mgnify:CR=1 FL=1
MHQLSSRMTTGLSWVQRCRKYMADRCDREELIEEIEDYWLSRSKREEKS